MYVFDIRWDVTTAGPSPDDNKRTEIYLSGCGKAVNGDPCIGCFNTDLWYAERGKLTSPEDIVARINKFASNKYVSICGGEPTDQLDELIDLARQLKKNGYHVLMYTWKTFTDLINDVSYAPLFESIDVVIDGVYDHKQRVYRDNGDDGLFSSIGSGNQRVIDTSAWRRETPRNYISYRADELKGIAIGKDGSIAFKTIRPL